MDRESILADLFDNPRYQAGWDRLEKILKIAGDNMKIVTENIGGRQVVYVNDPVHGTEFLVQVGHGKKGSYKTRYKITGNLRRSVLYYHGINIGNGYKKRLIAPSLNKPLLARAWS